MSDSHDSLQKALMRPGDHHLRRGDRQMFGNFVELSPSGGTAGALRNVRPSASVVETPTYDEPKLWQVDLQFSGPRGTSTPGSDAVPLSPWVPALGALFSVVVTIRAALDRDKRVTTYQQTLAPLDGLTTNGVPGSRFSTVFQAAHQLGVSVEVLGAGQTSVLGVQASVVEVGHGDRDAYGNAIIDGANAGNPFLQSNVTQLFLAPNPLRRQFFVSNWGNAPLFVAFGEFAAGPSGGPPTFTFALPSRGAVYESPRDCWQGSVSGVWSIASATGTDFATVTEGF